METLSITKVLLHPHWGAPMEYHKLIRVEQDLVAQESYFVFSSYYSKQVHDAGGMAMTNTTINLKEAIPAAPLELLQSIVDKVDGEFEGGMISVAAAPVQ